MSPVLHLFEVIVWEQVYFLLNGVTNVAAVSHHFGDQRVDDYIGVFVAEYLGTGLKGAELWRHQD